jgi:hypothetical protein
MAGYCEMKHIQCDAVALKASRDAATQTLLKEARKDFDAAAADYEEAFDLIQSDIDDRSRRNGCPDCPFNTKSIGKSFNETMGHPPKLHW